MIRSRLIMLDLVHPIQVRDRPDEGVARVGVTEERGEGEEDFVEGEGGGPVVLQDLFRGNIERVNG